MKFDDSPTEPTLGRRALHLGLLAIAVSGVCLWLVLLWTQRGDPQVWHKDWLCLHSAGASFLEQGALPVYQEQCIENYVWLYPPYMLYPYALASFLPPLWFYATVVIEISILTLLSLLLLSRSLVHDRSFETIALFVMGSSAFLTTLITGQHSALLLMGIAGALWAMRNDRRIAAGAFLGILGIKPNWAVFFVLWLLVTRRWRELGAMAAVGITLILSTLPMGVEVWVVYLTETPKWIEMVLNPGLGAYSQSPHKLITFEAFIRSILGAASPLARDAAWLALESMAAAACLLVWLRAKDVADQIAVTTLAVVGANLYVEFYDALALAVPAAIWWMGRDRYGSATWIVIGVAAGAIWLWHWIWTLATPGPDWPSLIGGFLAIWIGAEAFRVYRETRSISIARSRPPTPPTPDLASG